MGVVASGSAHARPSPRPPFDLSGNFHFYVVNTDAHTLMISCCDSEINHFQLVVIHHAPIFKGSSRL